MSKLGVGEPGGTRTIRIPSPPVAPPSDREGSHTENGWTIHLSNGVRSRGPTHASMHSYLVSPFPRWITRSPVIVFPITSPPPLSLSFHALLNQFRVSFDLQVPSLLCTCLFVSFSFFFPSLLATTASIETSTSIVISLSLLYIAQHSPSSN